MSCSAGLPRGCGRGVERGLERGVERIFKRCRIGFCTVCFGGLPGNGRHQVLHGFVWAHGHGPGYGRARGGVGFLADRPYTRISGGEQQLVLIARALAQNASTIIMDEPTSALDYGNTVRVLSCVRQLAEEGLTIIQSTHQPDQAFLYADKTLVLHEGRVLAYGEPKETITEELISKIYGVEVEVNSLYDDKVRVCVPAGELARR